MLMANIEEACEACMQAGFRRGTVNLATGEMEWSREDGSYAIIHDEAGQNCRIQIVKGEEYMGKNGGGYSEQEKTAIDKEIAQVNKDTGASTQGGKTDGAYSTEGDGGACDSSEGAYYD